MSETADRLVYMANQIARNFTVLDTDTDAAAAATAEHIRLFWDPRMRAAIRAGDRAGLGPVAAAAIDLLDQPGE